MCVRMTVCIPPAARCRYVYHGSGWSHAKGVKHEDNSEQHSHNWDLRMYTHIIGFPGDGTSIIPFSLRIRLFDGTCIIHIFEMVQHTKKLLRHNSLKSYS